MRRRLAAAAHIIAGCILAGCLAGCQKSTSSSSDASRDRRPQPEVAAASQTADRINEAKAWMSQGETDKAIAVLSRLIDSGASDPEVFVARAQAYEKKQQFVAEAADYTRAIALKPDMVEWRLQRAIARLALNQVDAARADCDEVISTAPRNAAALALRAGISIREGEYQAAVDDCDKAVELQPHFFAAYSNRGLASLKLGRLREAVNDLTEAIKLNNTSFEAYLNRGACYEKLGENKKALADWTAAIELRPAANLAHSNRAELNARIGHYADAIADYTTLIEAVQKMPALRSGDPRMPRATLAKLYLDRGQAELKSGSPAEALADAKRAVEMGAEPEASDNLRKAAEKQLAAEPPQ